MALTGFDTKRYVCSDNVHRLDLGQYELHAVNDVDWDDVNI